ncbi:hypothetical protein [Neobacillus dielmonensis]|uniref:hypothetical protein n=1 Tax=Neobacillus dielmonensis TaxID=1347369 RepID=UPI0005A9FACF|nr:hypothetical protein [Neobacillus dielmonensis]
MTRVELHRKHTKPFSWKGFILILIGGIILAMAFFTVRYYYQTTIRIDAPEEKLGDKVVIQLPNGQEVYTYENLIVEKNGKMYYKGEQNTMDLTGGTVRYENWQK